MDTQFYIYMLMVVIGLIGIGIMSILDGIREQLKDITSLYFYFNDQDQLEIGGEQWQANTASE